MNDLERMFRELNSIQEWRNKHNDAIRSAHELIEQDRQAFARIRYQSRRIEARAIAMFKRGEITQDNFLTVIKDTQY